MSALAWTVKAANESEQDMVPGLLDAALRRGFTPSAGALDEGYDGQPMYGEFESRGFRPVIALEETPAVKAGKHKPPACEHGEWTKINSFAGRNAGAY